MTPAAKAAVVALVAFVVLVAGSGVVLLVTVTSSTPGQRPVACGTEDQAQSPVVKADLRNVPDLDAAQSRNAGIIIGVGRSLKVPDRGLAVAIATAMQEAGIRNLASRANPGSLAYPHDGVAAGDHDSVGIFQQRDAWGSLAERMNVAKSARLFFTGGHAGQRGLLDVPGWEVMSVAVAAQSVQVSAFPSAYAQWESLAFRVVAAAGNSKAPVPVVEPAVVKCEPDPAADEPVAAGSVVYPVAKGTDRHNYGGSGSHWARGHTGTDFSIGCGTPVLAATGGRIIIDTTQGWAGRWLVKVSTGAHAVTTWYAHMQALHVRQGQTVKAGQRIGDVGQLGNATGCHLHFEVHPHNGSIYEDGIDPSPWLAKNAGKRLPGTVPAADTGRL